MPPKTPLKLDLGCGQRPTEGFEGVDIAPGDGVSHVVDLFKPGWPFADRSVSEIVSHHLIEHIPHDVGQDRDGWFVFWDEVYRILKRGGTVTVTCPYVKNERSFWDPTHTRYIHEMNFYYLNREWMEAQGLDHYSTDSNFEVTTISVGTNDSFAAKHHEAQQFAQAHYWNALGDLQVELKAIK